MSRPVGVVDAAVRVADGDDLRAGLGQQPRRDAADVAEALDGDGGALAASMPRSLQASCVM